MYPVSFWRSYEIYLDKERWKQFHFMCGIPIVEQFKLELRNDIPNKEGVKKNDIPT